MKEKMKKFEELKKLAEKHLDYDYDVETLKQYCELEPQEIEYINMTNPKTILDLLADREQLRRTLESFATPENITHTMYPRCICHSCFAREALKKSDEVENEKSDSRKVFK